MGAVGAGEGSHVHEEPLQKACHVQTLPPSLHRLPLHITVCLGVLIIGDICLKRSSMFSQSCSVPAAHFGYEIMVLSPGDLCHIAVDGQ